jgi:FMN hydrolase / 5-amino-6-(5-phospho-D-ribitylamino)uracil phosphatase
MSPDAAARKTRPPPTLLADVMDTLVRDPFNNGMHQHLGFATQKDLLAAKKDGTWITWELGACTEEEMAAIFFDDPLQVLDVPKFRQFLTDAYELLPGVAKLLTGLQSAGVPVSAFSNYPEWWELVEEKCRLEADYGVRWHFVSCCEKLRKPDLRAYERAASNAGVPISQCILIDDRQVNCEAATKAGFMAAIQFKSASQCAADLVAVYAEAGFDITFDSSLLLASGQNYFPRNQ